jgi:hypothetical protein
MIFIQRFNEMLLEVVAEVNTTAGKRIGKVILSPTEQRLVKKLDNVSGLALAVKMPDVDSDIQTIDDYSENNHCLMFLLEKVDPGKFSESEELAHYAAIQKVMQRFKELILERGLNGNACGGEETLSKAFRTEWEYQIYGGFNGMSLSFDLQDFQL